MQTITSILSKREYCGDTVNFRTTRKSFKEKEIIHNDEDKIKIFPDTHPAIISRELFERVQERLSKRKRMKRIEDVPLFMCMIVCADCKSRMHLMRTRNKNHGHYDAYVCSRYRNADKSRKFCTSHYIREEVLRTEVLRQIRSVHYDFLHDRESFRQMILERLQESETISKESLDCQIEDMNARLANQKDFLRHTFENFIRELVPKEALADMSRHYADQTEELELRLEKLRRKRAEESEVLKNLEQFFNALSKYKEITELTPEILCDLVDKIEVHEGIKIKGSREKISQVDIYYVGAGKLKD